MIRTKTAIIRMRYFNRISHFHVIYLFIFLITSYTPSAGIHIEKKTLEIIYFGVYLTATLAYRFRKKKEKE